MTSIIINQEVLDESCRGLSCELFVNAATCPTQILYSYIRIQKSRGAAAISLGHSRPAYVLARIASQLRSDGVVCRFRTTVRTSEEPSFDSRQTQEAVSFVPSSVFLNDIRRLFPSRGNRPGSEAHHSLLPRAEIKNEWS
jgi:hypothetical protein